jgi:hypothetical protein
MVRVYSNKHTYIQINYQKKTWTTIKETIMAR